MSCREKKRHYSLQFPRFVGKLYTHLYPISAKARYIISDDTHLLRL